MLLDGGVGQPAERIAVGAGVEAVAEQMLDGQLDRAHVHTTGEVEVGARDVAVALLLGGPAAAPLRPGVRLDPGPVRQAAEAVSAVW